MITRMAERFGRMNTDIIVESRRELRKEARFYKKAEFVVITKSKDFVALERGCEVIRITLIRRK